ncbi:MAG: hypothetical protein ACTSYB_06640 [Candidatus Helarchaeota archaeon]
MKFQRIFLGVFLTFICIGLFILPVFGLAYQAFTTFPANDAADDVSWNNTGSLEEFQGSGDYIDWVDIISVSITGEDIVIDFQGAGSRSGENYTFGLSIDVDNDMMPDYVIVYNYYYGGYILQNQKSGSDYYGYIWSGSTWLYGVYSPLPITDVGVTLTLKTVVTALNTEGYTLSSSKFRLYVFYTDESTFSYGDFLPDLGSAGGIPGFHILPTLFSILTLLALITIYKSKKNNDSLSA